ncbi:hypothetical protein [Streptomyces sp. NPDC049881]
MAITISRLLAVYMTQDLDRGYYTWDPIAEIPLGGAERRPDTTAPQRY